MAVGQQAAKTTTTAAGRNGATKFGAGPARVPVRTPFLGRAAAARVAHVPSLAAGPVLGLIAARQIVGGALGAFHYIGVSRRPLTGVFPGAVTIAGEAHQVLIVAIRGAAAPAGADRLCGAAALAGAGRHLLPRSISKQWCW